MKVRHPRGWTRCTLLEISDLIRGVSFPKDSKTGEPKDGYLACLRTTNIQSETEWDDLWFVPKEFVRRNEQLLQVRDILISTANSLELVGKVSFIKELPMNATLGAFITCIRINKLLNPKLFYYQLRSVNIRKNLREMASTTVNISNISTRKLKSLELVVPLLPEQHRIVAKIEELFSRLDAGVEALKQVQTQLKQYRQAVLKAAVEGRLTAQWREEHKGELEPASELLQRILRERREKWEAEQLAKYGAKGQQSPKNWREKYKEPAQPDTANLPELPEGWVWCSFEQIAQHKPNAIKAGPFGSALKKEFYIEKGHKIYGQEQVIRNDPSYGDYYIDEKRFQALRSCEVAPGDILISLVGTIGRILILPDEIEPGIINPRLVKLSLDRRAMAQVYIRTYLESPASKAFFQIVSHGGTMDILNLTILKQLPVPLPPQVEQIEIVNAIDAIETNIAYLTATSNMELSRMSLLRQSILRKAFEGKLVPQDPNDEPAEVLLERIRAEKAKGEAEQKAKRRKKNSRQVELGVS